MKHVVEPKTKLVRTAETAPDSGLLGSARMFVDASSDPPRLTPLQVLDMDGRVVMEHRYDDERELAPGYRRPFRIVTRWFLSGTPTLMRQRTVTIQSARVGAESSVKHWRPDAASRLWLAVR